MKSSQIEMERMYQKWYSDFWENQAALSQIVIEEFPDVDDGDPVTRYDVDMIRGLAMAVGALVEGYDRQNQ